MHCHRNKHLGKKKFPTIFVISIRINKLSRLIDLQSSIHSQVNILIGTKVFSDWDAVKILAHLTVMDGSDVE